MVSPVPMAALDTVKCTKWYFMQVLGTVALVTAPRSTVWDTLKPRDW